MNGLKKLLNFLLFRRWPNGSRNSAKSRWKFRFGFKTEEIYCVICLEREPIDNESDRGQITSVQDNQLP